MSKYQQRNVIMWFSFSIILFITAVYCFDVLIKRWSLFKIKSGSYFRMTARKSPNQRIRKSPNQRIKESYFRTTKDWNIDFLFPSQRVCPAYLKRFFWKVIFLNAPWKTIWCVTFHHVKNVDLCFFLRSCWDWKRSWYDKRDQKPGQPPRNPL